MNGNFNKIKEIIKRGVDKGDFPGAQFCLIEDKKVKCGFYGYNSLYPLKSKLKGDEIYDIASLSKIISTTTLILQLIEKEIILLETPLKKILPNYFDNKTTIYELLTHQSGLPPIVSNSNKLFTKEDLVKQIYLERFSYEPRSKIVYSDVGYKLLGFAIEKIYEKPLNKIAKKEIFSKVKMKNTSYRPNFYKSVVTEYREDHLFKGYVRGIVHDERSYLLEGLAGHAGVFSSAKDISKYIYSFLNDEKILKNETKAEIFNLTVTKDSNYEYKLARSLGFQKFASKPETNDYLITHTGFTGCNMWIDKKHKRGFVLLSNAIHPKREDNKIFSYREEILNLFL